MMLAVSVEDAERIEASLMARMAKMSFAGLTQEAKAYADLGRYITARLQSERTPVSVGAVDRAEAQR